MGDHIKLVGTETSLLAATVFSNAKLIRVFNNTAGAVTISRLQSVADGGAVIGTCQMPAGSTEVFEKNPLEQISAGSAVLATAVGYA